MKVNTVHLVYVKNKNFIQSPFSIGNNLYEKLKKKFKVKFYRWDVIYKIKPKKNDILIGHSHPNPYTVFRLSMKNKLWKKVILLQPFTTNINQVGFLFKVLPYCDRFISICGNYWFNKTKNSYFKKWIPIMSQQDMAIDIKNYPFIKKKFNKRYQRKFIYIGNSAQEKNLDYLKSLANSTSLKNFSSIGANIVGLKNYGYLNLRKNKSKNIISKYDFLIMTSKFDANPTVILEAISYGLIPVVTHECGFSKIKGIINLDLNNRKYNLNLIKKLQQMPEKNLLKIQKEGKKIIENSTWNNFFKNIIYNINLPKFKKITDKNIENKGYKLFKKSNHYHLRRLNIINFIKSNLKYYLLKS